MINGHNPAIGVIPFDFAKHLCGAPEKHIAHTRSELALGGLMRSRTSGPEAGDGHVFFHRQGRRHDLTINRANGLGLERTCAAFNQAPNNLLFPLWGINGKSLPAFYRTDFARHPRPLIQQPQEINIDRVDFRPQLSDVRHEFLGLKARTFLPDSPRGSPRGPAHDSVSLPQSDPEVPGGSRRDPFSAIPLRSEARPDS